jgi:hypothetical protein
MSCVLSHILVDENKERDAADRYGPARNLERKGKSWISTFFKDLNNGKTSAYIRP